MRKIKGILEIGGERKEVDVIVFDNITGVIFTGDIRGSMGRETES